MRLCAGSGRAGPRVVAPGRQHRAILRGQEGQMQADDENLPRRVEKPWGHEIWYALTDRYAGKILHVEAGHRLSLQFHEQKDESCYVLSGRLLLIPGDSPET